ncbi:MAG TPA: hypothetical protein VGL42_02350 [Opitutaceae bacterium]|jgi:hypothetical protein
MTFSRLALFLASLSLVAVHAHAGYSGGGGDNSGSDSDSDQNKKPPTEVPDFSHLDEYIYVPHSNLNYGYRFSNGPRVTFSGHANVTPDMANNAQSAITGSGLEGVTDHSSPDIQRVYHDGQVGPDTRANLIDLGNGQADPQSPIASADGKTNNWGYYSPSQITSEDFVQFHEYSDTTNGSPSFTQNSRGNVGLEAYVAYDFKHLSKKVDLKLFVGVSLNDIAAATMSTVSNTLTTVTDTYSLYGATAAPPGGPGSSGTTSVLISAAPVIPTQISTDSNAADLTEHFKVHGAYMTIRFGPELDFNFSDHWKVSLSLGPTLIYAGSTLDTDSVLIPPTGFQIVDEIDSTTNRLLYGGYADLTLNYLISERTGFYLGGFDQMSTGYTQGASGEGGVFTTKVDFNNEHGVRSGMSYKF